MTSNPLLHFDAPAATPEPEQVRWQLSRVKWDFSGFVPSADVSGIHSLHWYPAPFPPALAATLIDILGVRGGVFVDPFAGSGVAPIEAWLRGHRVLGVDNNHLAIEICRAKTRLLRLANAPDGERLANSYRKYRRARIWRWLGRECLEICDLADINQDARHWFTREVLAEIAVAKTWLEDRTSGPGAWRDVARVVLSSLLHGKLSTVRKYHYTYVVDRSRVKKRALAGVDVEGLFADRLMSRFLDAEYTRARLGRGGTDVAQLPEPEFKLGLAQRSAGALSDSPNLIVTSPSYFGMNDYVRSQYLSWLVFSWKGYDDQIKSESGSRRARTSKPALDAYFDALKSTFEALQSRLAPGGYVAVVMGNSTSSLARKNNPTSVVFDSLVKLGLNLVWRERRRIRFRKINNSPYQSEVIWVFSR